MARLLPALLVVALLGGSAAAFAVTERLKLERSPILATRVDKEVSPTSGEEAAISFRLRKSDRLSVAIVNAEGDVVRDLVSSRHAARGEQDLSWDGRDNAGAVVPDGVYKPRVHLSHEHRTILLPNPIRVDTVAPKIALASLNQRVFSPDRDFRHDYLLVRYRVSEPARAVLYANGHLVVKTKSFTARTLTWTGRADGLARPAGRYRLRLRAIDRAGNVGPTTKPFSVRIRYIELAPHRLHARAGGKIVVRVATDARFYMWRIGSRHARVRARRLALAAGAPGQYVLAVSARGHSDRAIVVVEP